MNFSIPLRLIVGCSLIAFSTSTLKAEDIPAPLPRELVTTEMTLPGVGGHTPEGRTFERTHYKTALSGRDEEGFSGTVNVFVDTPLGKPVAESLTIHTPKGVGFRENPVVNKDNLTVTYVSHECEGIVSSPLPEGTTKVMCMISATRPLSSKESEKKWNATEHGGRPVFVSDE